MLNKTLVLTHQENYLNGEFINKESIIYYDLGYINTLIDCKRLLKDDSY